MSKKLITSLVLFGIGIGAYAVWYTYHRQAVIAETARCNDQLAHPETAPKMRASDGSLVPAMQPCLLQATPPSFFDLIRGRVILTDIPAHMRVGSSSFENILLGRYPLVPDVGLPCDQSATTTDCASIVPSPMTPQTISQGAATTTQSGKIDEHLTIDNTLRPVDFCGTTHLTKQIVINGVDVIKKIIYLAENKLLSINGDSMIANDFCKSFARLSPSEQIPNPKMTGDLIQVEMKIPDVESWRNQNGHVMYNIYLPSWFFSVDSATNDIYLIGGYDGSLIGPIGSLT